MPYALAAAFPTTTLQTCVVHLIRHSLEYAGGVPERQDLVEALRPIYTAASAEAAADALEDFAGSAWGARLPSVVAAWRRAWPQVIPFFAFPPDVRRVIDTTNALENVHRQLRKIIKTRGHFPTDEAVTKLLWLALRNITATWTLPIKHWVQAMRQFAIIYDDRFNAKMAPARMDAAVALDAPNALTATWTTAETAGSHNAHTPHRRSRDEHEDRGANSASHTQILTLPNHQDDALS